MKNLTLENIARVCGGTYYGPADKLQEEVMSVITDSRKAEEGCLPADSRSYGYPTSGSAFLSENSLQPSHNTVRNGDICLSSQRGCL